MKSRVILPCVILVCALLQGTLVILDEFNPLMGFLTSHPAKFFLLAFSLVCIGYAAAQRKRRK